MRSDPCDLEELSNISASGIESKSQRLIGADLYLWAFPLGSASRTTRFTDSRLNACDESLSTSVWESVNPLFGRCNRIGKNIGKCWKFGIQMQETLAKLE